MKEIAFQIKRDSEFYKKYFETKAEKEKFHKLARIFFEKYNLLDNLEYYQTEFLGLKLTIEQKERFKKQIKKYADDKGMSIFKKLSPMQKAWEEEVTSNINFQILDQNDWWYGGMISYGSHSLWDYNSDVYGYLLDRHKDEIKLPDYMVEIKLSRYHSIIESFDDQKGE